MPSNIGNQQRDTFKLDDCFISIFALLVFSNLTSFIKGDNIDSPTLFPLSYPQYWMPFRICFDLLWRPVLFQLGPVDSLLHVLTKHRVFFLRAFCDDLMRVLHKQLSQAWETCFYKNETKR